MVPPQAYYSKIVTIPGNKTCQELLMPSSGWKIVVCHPYPLVKLE